MRCNIPPTFFYLTINLKIFKLQFQIKNTNEMPHVYKITSPSNRIYVGSTIDVKRRQKDYKTFKGKGQPKLFRSILKYGWEAHNFEIICECELKDMLRLEAEHGHRLKVLGENGLNILLPKHDDIYSPRTLSAETRLKISIKAIGRKRTEEQTRKQSEAMTGRQSPMKGKKYDLTPEQRAQRSEKSKNRIVTQATKDKHSISSKDRRHSPKTIKLMCEVAKIRGVSPITRNAQRENQIHNASNGKLVINLETGIYYNTIASAARTKPNLSRVYIQGMINGSFPNKSTFILA